MPRTFSDLLNAAETRMDRDPAALGLAEALAMELASELKASGIVIVRSGHGEVRRLLQVGPSNFDNLKCTDAPIGRVFKGTVHEDSTDAKDQFVQTAAAFADGVNIVLTVLSPGQIVDDELLISAVEVLADLYRRKFLDGQAVAERQRRAFDALVTQLHSTLDAEAIANTLATDGVVATQASVISVARKAGRRWTVVAGTGVSQPNNRSDAARRTLSLIETLANSTADAKIPQKEDSPEVVVKLLATDDVASTSANWAAVFFPADQPPTAWHDAVDAVCHHAALAFKNCDQYAATSISHRLTRIRKAVFNPRSAILLTLLILSATYLCFTETTLQIEAYGELVPTQRSFVFAPEDGTIEVVAVHDGVDVAIGETLCVLTNEDLEVQMEGLVGELAAAEARLVAIDALKGRPSHLQEAGILSAEQLELKERSASLTRQSEILQRRLDQLTVTAKMRGRIYGDRLRELLTRRPVRRGQYLFEISAPQAAWQLNLRVSEFDIRHISGRTADATAPLPVRYALETSPEIMRDAKVKSIAAAATTDVAGTLSTLMMADVGRVDFSQERPGTGVVGYVDCGQRRRIYVWFRKIIEFVQRNIWF